VSLALKATTQSTIVSKLSAYARNNRTKRALWEYDNLIQSLYLLNYIDSASLRQNVQRAVNRGESYHQLRRTISYANYGKLRFGTEYEQHLWSECSRLIANCIIFYNATLLSKLFAHEESRGDMQGTALVKQVSPVAWQHVNLYGRYEFRKQPEPVDVDEIVGELAESGSEPRSLWPTRRRWSVAGFGYQLDLSESGDLFLPSERTGKLRLGTNELIAEASGASNARTRWRSRGTIKPPPKMPMPTGLRFMTYPL
jgi:Tn3 transposase DDE domain